MSIERIFYCDWRECNAHVQTANARPQTAFITVTESVGQSLHFCGWDCLMKHAAQFEPPTIIPFHPGDDEPEEVAS